MNKVYGRPRISFHGATTTAASFDGSNTTEYWRYDDNATACETEYVAWINWDDLWHNGLGGLEFTATMAHHPYYYGGLEVSVQEDITLPDYYW